MRQYVPSDASLHPLTNTDHSDTSRQGEGLLESHHSWWSFHCDISIHICTTPLLNNAKGYESSHHFGKQLQGLILCFFPFLNQLITLQCFLHNLVALGLHQIHAKPKFKYLYCHVLNTVNRIWFIVADKVQAPVRGYMSSCINNKA